MLPSAPVATATIWPKFHGDGVPAAVVAGSGHAAASVYDAARDWSGAPHAASRPRTAEPRTSSRTERDGWRT